MSASALNSIGVVPATSTCYPAALRFPQHTGVLPPRGNGTAGAIHRHMFNGDQERTAREMLNLRNSHEAFQRTHGLSVSN